MTIREGKSGEAKINALKNSIARDVMSIVKGVIPSNGESNIDNSEFETSVTLSNYFWTKNIDTTIPDNFDPDFDESPGSNLFFDVLVNIKRDQNFIAPFDIKAYALSDALIPEIEIIVTKRESSISTNLLNDFRKDLGNAIRHEIEHLTQKGTFKSFDRGERYYDFSILGNISSDSAKYFLNKEEIPAFVRGFSDHATSLEDLESSMRDMLDAYADTGNISHSEEDIILSTWIDWAKRNLNKKKFK